MADLRRVRGNGCVLYYPPSFQHPELLRGGQGYIVDLDAPCEREWCAGQEYKLEPAPEGSIPNAIVHPLAMRKIQAALAGESAVKAPAKPAVAPKPVLTDDDLDESKRASRKAKAGAA